VANFNRFEAFELDVLKEVGNIGAGNAATALSTLLNKPIDMAVPSVRIVPFEEVAEKVGGPEKVVVAVFLRVDGDAPGNMFFIMQEHSAKVLMQQLLNIDREENEPYSELELSTLCEIGNILAGSYLSSLADFTQLTLQPSVPAVVKDFAGPILNYGIMQYGEMGETALLIETQFLEDHKSLDGHFFLIPDPASFETLFKSLGVGQ
jgi:chemotaxis protein CheC